MKIILYTIHCPACNVLDKKMKAKNIEYEVIDDLQLLNEKGMTQFPILEVDGTLYEYSDAVKFINAY